MSVLHAAIRKRLPKGDFAIPEKAPGPGSYPLVDPRNPTSLTHARLALELSAGKPEAARVKAAVYRKFPQMRPK